MRFETVSSCYVTCQLRKETDTLTETSFQTVVRNDEVSLQPSLLPSAAAHISCFLVLSLASFLVSAPLWGQEAGVTG